MPKISEERRAERREQILAGARRCFAEHGYEGATVARLEEAIGLRGAIFNSLRLG
jgi:AcrR family transcriptional regulator